MHETRANPSVAGPVTLDYLTPEPRKPSGRLRGAAVVVSSGFLATILCFILANVYGSIRGGEVFIFMTAPVCVFGLIALVLAMVIPPKSRRGFAGLIVLCLSPALLMAVILIAQNISFRIDGPSDRF